MTKGLLQSTGCTAQRLSQEYNQTCMHTGLRSMLPTAKEHKEHVAGQQSS